MPDVPVVRLEVLSWAGRCWPVLSGFRGSGHPPFPWRGTSQEQRTGFSAELIFTFAFLVFSSVFRKVRLGLKTGFCPAQRAFLVLKDK